MKAGLAPADGDTNMELWLTRDKYSWCLWNKKPDFEGNEWLADFMDEKYIEVGNGDDEEVCGIPLEIGGIARVKLNLRYLMEGEEA